MASRRTKASPEELRLRLPDRSRPPCRPRDGRPTGAARGGTNSRTQADLAARIRERQAVLARRLSRTEVLTAMIRDANATVEPARTEVVAGKAAAGCPVRRGRWSASMSGRDVDNWPA